MTLLQELYRVPLDDFEIEPEDRISRTNVNVSGSFSFLTDTKYVDFYKQMITMPEFDAILEKSFAKAVQTTIFQFKKQNTSARDYENWVEAIETQLNAKYAGAKEEHQG